MLTSLRNWKLLKLIIQAPKDTLKILSSLSRTYSFLHSQYWSHISRHAKCQHFIGYRARWNINKINKFCVWDSPIAVQRAKFLLPQWILETCSAELSNTPASAQREIPGTSSSVMNEKRKAASRLLLKYNQPCSHIPTHSLTPTSLPNRARHTVCKSQPRLRIETTEDEQEHIVLDPKNLWLEFNW